MAAGLLCLALSAPALAGTPAEFFNEFDWAPTAPTPGPTNFEIVFAGDVSCQIPPQNYRDGSTDPFPHPKPITTTYDPGSNTTTVAFSGKALTPGQRYHFGLNQGYSPTPPLKVLSKSWSYASSAPSPLPIVSVSPPPPRTPKARFKYAIVYLEAAFAPNGQTYGSWYEVPYTPRNNGGGVQPVLTFENFGTQPLYITNTGIQFDIAVPNTAGCAANPDCSANRNLLRNLDFGLTPPPGQPGSKFVAMASPPPAILPPSPLPAEAAAAKTCKKTGGGS